MRKLVALSVLTFACISLLWMPKARTAANDEAEIRQLIDRWAKAFRAKDLNAIMSIYQPGQALVAFDVVPPLQYLGSDAYKGRCSRPLVNLFPRLITGRRRLSLQKVSNVMP